MTTETATFLLRFHFITTLSFSSHLWYLKPMHTLTGPYAAVGPASPPHRQEGA